MSTEEDFQVKNEYDDSNFYYQDYKDGEKYENNKLNDSVGELTYIKTPNDDSISVQLRLGNRILFCSGKYFYIERTTDQTDHQKEFTGIVTTCHTCGVQIRGSLKVSSNFISHLKGRHPEVYQEFLKQKREASAGTTIRKSDRPHLSQARTSPYHSKTQILSNILQQENNEQFHRNVLQFLVGTNQSLNIVEDTNFVKLFDVHVPMKIKKSFQYAQIIKDDCKYKQLQLANFFNSSEVFICFTSDVWCFGECKYLALSSHWIDDQYQRQTALLSCTRSPIEGGKCLQTIQNDVLLRYGLRKNFIVNTITKNIQNYTNDFLEIGLDKEVLCFDNLDQTEDCTLLQQIKENLKLTNVENIAAFNFSQLDFLKLPKIWSITFSKHLDEDTRYSHLLFMNKCSAIWKKSNSAQFKENFDMILNGCLTPPNLLNITSLYTALKQLQVNKDQISQICAFVEKPSFSNYELEYLEELIDVFEPLNAAFEFLDLPQNHYYGCFLPTLVTLKWKLTRLYNSKKLKHLQEPLFKLKEQLLIEFRSYYELSDTISEAVLAAITYPPVKTRFLTGLQDSISCANFQARNFLLKYAKDYHLDNDGQIGANITSYKQENGMGITGSATDFFDFGDDNETIPGDYQAPDSLKLEIDAYLAENDNTLTSLQKYPTIKKMFLRYNTCIPSPASVLRTFPLHKILKTSLLTSCTHEQFEDLIFYQSHLLEK